MIIMMRRREKILEVTGEMFPVQFEKSSMETVRLCEEKCGRMAAGFLRALGEAAKQAFHKEDVQYLQFSCLHSSIFLRNYLIRIGLMGQKLYDEQPLAVSYWDAGDIYRLFEEDISVFRRGMAGKVPRLNEYEMDYVRYAYAPYYHRMAKAFITEMMGEILEEMPKDGQEGNEAQSGQEEDGQIKILFGEYMGEADLLFTIGKEQFNEVFQDLCG